LPYKAFLCFGGFFIVIRHKTRHGARSEATSKNNSREGIFFSAAVRYLLFLLIVFIYQYIARLTFQQLAELRQTSVRNNFAVPYLLQIRLTY
jgi:cell division septal protein FtsQ